MERRAERIPALSDDFADQVMAKMNGRKERAHPRPLPREGRPNWQRASSNEHPSLGRGWGWVCWWVSSIAAVLVLAFLLWPKGHETSLTPTSVQPTIVEAHTQPESSPVVEIKKEEALAQVQPTSQPAKVQRTVVKEKSSPSEPVPAQETPEEGSRMTGAGYDEVDPKAQLLAAEIAHDEAVHQKQTAYEREMAQRSLELLISIMASEEEQEPAGSVKIQKS